MYFITTKRMLEVCFFQHTPTFIIEPNFFSYFDLMLIPIITPSVQRDLRASAHHRHVVPFCVTGNFCYAKKDPT